MSVESGDLIERIRERCQRQRWYGPDMEHPSAMRDMRELSRDPASGRLSTISRDPWQDSRVSGFAFPPATTAQLRATEDELGFSLPAMLRQIYAEVANGGFGPGYGLMGASGGFPSRERQDSTIAATFYKGSWRIPASAASALRAHPDCYLECQTNPDGLLALCHWGCGIYSYVDLRLGQVYVAEACLRHDLELDAAEDDETPIVGLQYQADSLQAWFERWLRDDLSQFDATTPLPLDDLAHVEEMLPECRAQALARLERFRGKRADDLFKDQGKVHTKSWWHVPRGAQVPAISLPSTSGRLVDLAEAAQARHLVLFFYPGDREGLRYPELAGCTSEACAFRDSLEVLRGLGAEVFGINLHSTDRQREFIAREHLTFDLLSDNDEMLTRALGIPVWVSASGERFAARGTLIIQRGGEIAEVFANVSVPGHVEKVIDAIPRLR